MFHLPIEGKAIVEKDKAEDKRIARNRQEKKEKKTTGQLEANRKQQQFSVRKKRM